MAELGEIDLSSVLSVEEFNNYTAATATAFTSEQITATGVSAVTVYATEYENLPTATTTDYGVVIVDDHLDGDSENPVQNKVVADAITDLEDSLSSAITELRETLENDYYDKDEIDEIISSITQASGSYVTYNVFNNYTAATRNEFVTDNFTAVTANIENLTALTVSAATYNNLPTATTTSYGVVIVDDQPDSASTNPVENQAITNVILENERTVAAALNDINERKADKTYVDALVVDEAEAREDADGELWTAFEILSGACITGVTTAGTGNVVTMVEKDGKNVKATLGNVDTSSKLDINVFETFTAATLNDVSANTGVVVTSVEKDGDKVKVTKSSELGGLDGLTATTVSATTYDNLPTASTSNYGVTKIDDALDTGSTNPVANSAVTKSILDNELVVSAAINDLNNRKANITDIPTEVRDLNDYTDFALKTDLAGYLPLSGGTLTGGLSGTTVSADTYNAQTGFFQTSDERLKIFVGDLYDALDAVKGIPTKYFYWQNNPDGRRNLGTSAQKVLDIYPEVVDERDGKLSVDYAKLSIVAIAAIKELAEKVDDLQKQIDELKK